MTRYIQCAIWVLMTCNLHPGLAVDAKHGRLYYSNMGTTHVNGTAYTWHRIDTIKFDGTGQRTVVTRAEKPRALAIDADNK